MSHREETFWLSLSKPNFFLEGTGFFYENKASLDNFEGATWKLFRVRSKVAKVPDLSPTDSYV